MYGFENGEHPADIVIKFDFEFWIFVAWVMGIILVVGWQSTPENWLRCAGEMLIGYVVAILLAVWLGTAVIATIMVLGIVSLIVKVYLSFKKCWENSG